METGDKLAINTVLRNFKTESGAVKYQAVLSVPLIERIPELAKKDFPKMIMLITAALTLCFESMNLKRPMTAHQIVDLAEAIIDTSGEDKLSMEDLMLFLQKLVRGEYGVLYESMDIPKFMEKFETYREERWQQLNAIRNERQMEHKGMGDTNRNTINDPLDEHFSNITGQLNDMKANLRETRKENQKLKDIDKF